MDFDYRRYLFKEMNYLRNGNSECSLSLIFNRLTDPQGPHRLCKLSLSSCQVLMWG